MSDLAKGRRDGPRRQCLGVVLPAVAALSSAATRHLGHGARDGDFVQARSSTVSLGNLAPAGQVIARAINGYLRAATCGIGMCMLACTVIFVRYDC